MNFSVTVSSINAETVALIQPGDARCRLRRIKYVLLGVILVVGATAMILYFANIKRARQDVGQDNEKPSLSDGMAKDMAEYVDPCDDFYQYACGGYINRNMDSGKSDTYVNKFSSLNEKNIQVVKEAIEDIQLFGNDNDALVKAATYYTSCLDNDPPLDLSPYWKALKDIDGAPLADSLWWMQSEPSWNIVKVLQKLHLNYGTYPLFEVGVRPNLKNTSQNIFVVSFPDLGLTTKVVKRNMSDMMFGSENVDLKDKIATLEKLTKSFKKTVEGEFVSAAATKSGQDPEYVQQDVSDAINLERTILRLVYFSIYYLNDGSIHSIYQTVTVKELTTLMNDMFDWKEFLGGLVKGISDTAITNHTIVGLMVPKQFLSFIAYELGHFPKSAFANYFAWTLLKKLSPALPVTYFDAYHDIDEYNTVKRYQERWRACLKDTEFNMPLTTGLMFTEMTTTDTKRNLTLLLLKEVHRAFERGVDNIGWLDSTTRAAVKLKAKYMMHVVADFDHVEDRRAIEQRYAEITPPSNPSDIAAFLISCQRHLVKENLRLLDTPVPREEWITSDYNLYLVNAFYDRTKNLMVILAGIMQEPFLYENGPKYLNFGRLGAVIGHEMLHGFDSLGWYFDKTGNIAKWWTNQAYISFNRHAKCLENQYSKFPYGHKANTLYVNGNKTLAENIADNGGLKYAYQAYKQWAADKMLEEKDQNLNLNGDQLFFVSYAQLWCQAISDNLKPRVLSDEHSPAMYRVIGSLMNFKEFGNAFNCPIGSKMNPYSRCEFW